MWRHSLKDWEEVDLEVYKFCLSQAEKRLNNIISESEKITSRVYTLIGILIPVISICLGFVIKSTNDGLSRNFIYYTSLACIIILMVCLIFLANLIKAREAWHEGVEPRDIILSDYIERENLDAAETVKFLHVDQMESIQHKIDKTNHQNSMRISVFRNCLLVMIVTTIVIAIAILGYVIF